MCVGDTINKYSVSGERWSSVSNSHTHVLTQQKMSSGNLWLRFENYEISAYRKMTAKVRNPHGEEWVSKLNPTFTHVEHK